MYENIQLNCENFCIGPQSGTYCYVDYKSSPPVMKVKNEQGTLLRTYEFSPNDLLQTGPINYNDTDLKDNSGFFPPEVVSIKYAGPRNQSSIFDGAVFFTLERYATTKRIWRSFLRKPHEVYGDLVPQDEDESYTRVEYPKCVLRRWLVDNLNSRLNLHSSFIKNSDDDNWIEATAFGISFNVTELISSSARTSGLIEITTTSGLTKYDRLMLGPSKDVDNLNAVEEVYVHKVVNDTEVEIRSYSGGSPPIYDYVPGDAITIFGDAFITSNDEPEIDPSTQLGVGFKTGKGSLYRLDLNNYGETIYKDNSAIYHNVAAATWNEFYNSFSFIKDTSMLHLDITNYEIYRSQNIDRRTKKDPKVLNLFDVETEGETIYKLMDKTVRRDAAGVVAVASWTTYNINEDSMLPFSYSISVVNSNRVLKPQEVDYITVTVRDQYGVGLSGKNILFEKGDDAAASIEPLDGYLITDLNGKGVYRYDAGSTYQGRCTLRVRSDGSTTYDGSAYIFNSFDVTQVTEFESEVTVKEVEDYSEGVSVTCKSRLIFFGGLSPYSNVPPVDGMINIPTVSAYIFPGGFLEGFPFGFEPADNLNSLNFSPFLQVLAQPTLHKPPSSGEEAVANGVPIEMYLRTSRLELVSPSEDLSWYSQGNTAKLGFVATSVTQLEEAENAYNLSQNYISRHLLHGHFAKVSLDQFVFVQEARPKMWSRKNNIDTDYWIRLRPFASDLNPETLVIQLREESYLGDSGWVDITKDGTIVMFDAGSSLLGIEFSYNPPKNFHHNSIVYIKIEVYDTSPVPNLITLDYWFHIIQDYRAPYLLNKQPDMEQFNVPFNTHISFDVTDAGEGVDIDTLELFVNNLSMEYTYIQYEPNSYHVHCDVPFDFHYSQTVYVIVRVHDKSDNVNFMMDSWKFYVADSGGPWFDMDDATPTPCVEGLENDQTVALQVYGVQDTGIDKGSIKLEVGGKYRNVKLTPIVYRLN